MTHSGLKVSSGIQTTEMNEHPEIKILLIEDNPGDARLIREMIKEVRYQSFSLCHADTLSDGYDKLRGGSFDVVLLDNGLPDGSGIDSIQNIRLMSPELPVIILTGLDDEETAISSLKMGAQDYLVKGQIEADLLLRAIRYAIERKRAAEIIESKQRFIQHIADTTPDILYIFNIIDHYLVYANQALGDLLGYSQKEIQKLGHLLYNTFMHPDDLSRVYEYIRNISASEDNNIMDLECRVKHQNGQWRWMYFRSVVFSRTKEGAVIEILGTAHDITNRKETEYQIRASLEEKELLLREIHHRVKNNLTVIFSLLKLQSAHVRDDRDRELFQDSMARIKSMALIHEKLYQSGDVAHIDFNNYLERLLSYIFMLHGAGTGRISLKTDIESISLDIDTAIPCGLIVNELVTNCLKHAFPDDRKGGIRVALHKIPDVSAKHPEIELIVSDNGVGMPGNRKKDSLGLSMVHILAKQLQGHIQIKNDKGTHIRLNF